MKTKSPLLLVLFSVWVGLTGCAGLLRNGDDEIFYTALGASDAVGIGAFPLTKGYVFRIKDELEERDQDVDLLNLGIPGAEIDAIEDALDIVLRTGIDPDLVTIWTGANDIVSGDAPDDFEADLEDILEQLRDETSAFIVIADIPDLTKIPRFIERPSPVVTVQRVNAFNEAIEQQADAFDVPIVRLSEVDMLNELVSDIDGFHPNNEGHKTVADLFLEIILPEFGL